MDVTNDVSAVIIALVVVGLLALIMRWVFSPSRPRVGMPVDAAASADLGMLAVVASGLTRQQALQLRATLQDGGIRSSMSSRSDGAVDVLVFSADAARARRLLSLG
jgi:hypothetical protein